MAANAQYVVKASIVGRGYPIQQDDVHSQGLRLWECLLRGACYTLFQTDIVKYLI